MMRMVLRDDDGDTTLAGDKADGGDKGVVW